MIVENPKEKDCNIFSRKRWITHLKRWIIPIFFDKGSNFYAVILGGGDMMVRFGGGCDNRRLLIHGSALPKSPKASFPALDCCHLRDVVFTICFAVHSLWTTMLEFPLRQKRYISYQMFEVRNILTSSVE